MRSDFFCSNFYPEKDKSPLLAFFIWVGFFVLFSVADSWGYCWSGNYTGLYAPETGCYGGSELPNCGSWTPQGAKCTTHGYCLCSEYSVSDFCPDTLVRSDGVYFGAYLSYPTTICSSPPSVRCTYTRLCNDACEADSIVCINKGGTWEYDQNVNTCGGYTCKSCKKDVWNCVEMPLLHCDDIPNSSIYCKDGQCTGLPYSRWVSEYKVNCTNECGDDSTYSISSDTTVSIDATCNDSLVCGGVQCVQDGENYVLFKKCAVGRPVVGNNDTRPVMPDILYSGRGSCLDNGYEPSNFPNSSNPSIPNGPTSSDNVLNDECLLYGINCDNSIDTSNYNDLNNRTPTSCVCKPFDGLNSQSIITCPDGSSRVVFMSCNDWENAFKSSSSAVTPTPESSSSAEGVGGSSGSLDDLGKYPDYPEDTRSYNKNVQGALSGIGGLLNSVLGTLTGIKDYLTNDNQRLPDMSVSEMALDSFQIDYDTIRVNYLDSLWAVIDTAKAPIDTSTKSKTGVCPIITFDLSEVNAIPSSSRKQYKFNFGNFLDTNINLCSIIRSIVTGFATIISFFIGFKVFQKGGW